MLLRSMREKIFIVKSFHYEDVDGHTSFIAAASPLGILIRASSQRIAPDDWGLKIERKVGTYNTPRIIKLLHVKVVV
jgi:hypothetical protein